MAGAVETKDWGEPMKRLGFKGTIPDRINQWQNNEIYEAFCFFLSKYDETWHWDVAKASAEKNARNVVK